MAQSTILTVLWYNLYDYELYNSFSEQKSNKKNNIN